MIFLSQGPSGSRVQLLSTSKPDYALISQLLVPFPLTKHLFRIINFVFRDSAVSDQSCYGERDQTSFGREFAFSSSRVVHSVTNEMGGFCTNLLEGWRASSYAELSQSIVIV
jgi:hypothetical protein